MTKKLIVEIQYKQGEYRRRIDRLETDEEEAQREAKEKEDIAVEARRRAESVPLMCDQCGGQIGMVSENDLNGSRFYHTDCVVANN